MGRGSALMEPRASLQVLFTVIIKQERELCVSVNWPLMGLMVGNKQTRPVGKGAKELMYVNVTSLSACALMSC